MPDLFQPKFDAHGLLTAVVVHYETGAPLMVAHMNDLALARTRETGIAHFWSRSRGRLWKKGDPLAPSGLLGPVTLHTGVRLTAEN